MYRVPDYDWSFLVGRRIVDGNTGPFAVHWSFDDGMGMLIACAVSINDGEEQEVTEVMDRVMAFIGRTVASARRIDEWRLELRFTDDTSLVLVDNDDHYESFTINGPSTGGFIAV